MASITIKSNAGAVVANIRASLEQLKNPEYLIRPVCFGLIDLMTKRIHNQGKASDGGPIGTYSKGYLKLRQAKYKRTADTKIIVSLTRQLENDWSVIATPKGYGIGFLNSFNLQKARWVEGAKDRPIFDLTTSEVEYATDYLTELTNKAFDGQ